LGKYFFEKDSIESGLKNRDKNKCITILYKGEWGNGFIK